jgi:hypothetical protein
MCEDPNQAFISAVRNDPKACDTSSGIVIISIPRLSVRAFRGTDAIPTSAAPIETAKRCYGSERRSEVGQTIG